MRIVQLVENLELGGLERMAVDLALALQSAGHELLVYCLHEAGPLAPRLEAAGIPVKAFHKAPGFKLSTILALAKRLKADRVDVIHGHNPGVHHYAALAAKIAGTRACVNTRHSASTSTGVPYQEKYFRLVQPFTSHVVFVCEYARRMLTPRLNYPDSKCSVILNGIPLQPFQAKPASPCSLLPRIRFGAIGRFVPAKGYSILIDAFARIAATAPQAELSIFGYGPLESELAAQIERLHLQGRVRLAGRTSDPAAALQSLDVFIMSSVNEGLPLVILEAMAAGLPVVSTNVGGIPEVLASEYSWQCAPSDPAALASIMLSAAQCGDLASRGEHASRTAAEHYGVEHMAARYGELFRRLL